MNDDIVTRLRTDFEYYDHAQEAADEIERLRAEAKELLEALTEMAEKGMLPTITFRMRDAAEVLEKRVRDV